MPGPLDFAYFVLVAVVMSLYEHFIFWPHFRAEVARNAQAARLHAYRRAIVFQWAAVALMLAIWLPAGRPLADLGLAPPSGLRWIVSIAVVVAMVAFFVVQRRSVARASAEALAAVRPRLGGLDFMLPHTQREHRWFLALSLTAGVCEEIIYRGYFVWLLAPWLGVVGALVVITVLFGLGHSYQGKKGLLRPMAAGAVMGAIVLATGWVVPAMIVHALVDVGSGEIGFAVLRDAPA